MAENRLGALPAGTRGAISPGTYVLTEWEWYNSTSTIQGRSTLLVTVSNAVTTIQGIDEFIENQPFRYTRTLATNDPVTGTYTCIVPTPSIYGSINTPAASDYSATSTILILNFSQYRLTYTKQ